MKLSQESKLFIGIIIGTIALIGVAVAIFTKPEKTISKETLIPANAHTIGNKDAKVYLVEFSDFQCPACKAFEPTVEEVINKYKDQLLFVYRLFPLDQHPLGKPAALAAEAANRQGKFWEMHHLLFTNQDNFSDKLFSELARQLSLDINKFTADIKDPNLASFVDSEKAAGISIGVSATPTFYLNGKKLTLATFSDLDKEVQQALK